MNQEAFEESPVEKWAYGLMGGFLLVMVDFRADRVDRCSESVKSGKNLGTDRGRRSDGGRFRSER